MVDTFIRSERLRGLSELLAERRDWPLKERLAFVQKLARQVQTLHQNGRIHRAIGIDAIGVDEQLRPHLSPPGAPRRFGGEDDCDPEFCPPELTEPAVVELPAEIDRAAAALQKAGYALDPRRVDVYQLGALLCRLATGEPVLSYIYDATIKARVPAVVQPLLSGSLGFESPERWENCERLIEGLDEALRRTESLEAPTSMLETPARGSAIVPDAADDTPPQGTQQQPPEIVEPLPFTRLGHYRIVERIGAGGMGDVYRGYDESLERSVAVKVLPSQLARDADFVRRFHAEATAAAGVAHPNVVPIYFIGEDAGHHFFAMQCIEGESLAERLGRRGQFPVDEALELIGQCLAGLQAAHERGLIHRDIKPGNILLERGSGRAMLVDFGLVRRIGQSAQMTATGVIMGTVDYIAPEQARGRKVDARVDIYALGVLFYQLLSGRMPFTADSPTAMIFQHAYEEPFPLEEAVPGLPPPVAQIVERMMAKEPDHRYPDCGAVLADVRAYRQGQPLASDESAWASGFEEESSPGGELKLPEGLARLLDPGRVQVVRDWAATMFRRHAPEYVQQMQGTTQQVDVAVAHYRRRRNRLAKLLEEARAIEADLSQQIESNQSAASAAAAAAESAADEQRKQAALAKQCECEEQVTALRSQHELQQQAASDLERQLGKADATLARLCSQQEVMKARLQAAVAQQRMEVGLPRPKVRRWLLPASIGGAGLLGVALLMLLIPGRKYVPAPAPPVATPSVASKPAPAAEQPPKPNPKVPPGASLLMTFDKNTLVDVSGIIFRIRSLTDRCNGKDITAQYTPDGKVGGAISIVDGSEVRIPGHIVNRQPEYTVTAWFKRKDKEHLWVYGEAANGSIFAVEAQRSGAIMVRSWHHERIGNWMNSNTPEGLVPANQWVFVAVRLIKGDRLDKGELTIRVNDQFYTRNLQMAYSNNSGFSSIGAGNGSWADRKEGRGTGLVDELAVYPRALSDAEIETLYQMGLRGESLGM